MILRVATVLSARDWEARLCAAARTSASVRLVMRAFKPAEVADRATTVDVVVVGSETPWATPARLSSWRRLGLRVVGIHPVGDRPAAERLQASGLDLVLADDLEPEAMLREIRLLEPAASRAEASSALVTVTGPRGAPGRTEVAIAVAWLRRDVEPTTLVDADLEGPALAVRLGIDPRPDLTDAVDSVHQDGRVPPSLLHKVGRLGVIPGSHRPGDPPLRPDPVHDVVDAARVDSGVIVDTGPWHAASDLIKASDEAIVVIEGSPLGIIRAAALIAAWTGPPPRLVVNRVERRHRRDVLTAVRRWTGLEPVAVIVPSSAVATASRTGAPPPRVLLRALAPLHTARVAP